ncbi:MAG: antibiotic biosynthesis monooxygenase [Candidatus Dormibacteraeota bacterium]|nr:antibiotic biosynthesis monooxygenase [Candidatus Dormibacteraeota bacterium]
MARYRVKPGQEQKFLDELKSMEGEPPDGWLYMTVFRSTKDPNEIWVSVVFENEAKYKKSADSPEMDKQYRKTLELLQGEPEWHDGNVIHEAMRDAAKS